MLIDLNTKKTFNKIDVSESQLQKLIIENFKLFFPNLFLIQEEFRIDGDVRSFGISGRIDLLAIDKKQNRLVIFELKLSNSRNILIQALDYTDFIEEYFELIISRLKTISTEEKERLLEKKLEPKIILIAEKYTHPTIRRTEKFSKKIKLYNFQAFSDGMLQLSELTTKKKHIMSFDNDHKEYLNENIIAIVKEIIANDLIDEELILIENDILTVNSTILHNAYLKYFKGSNIRTLGKTNFFNILKTKNEYIQNLKTKRFKKNNTSVIEIQF